MDDWRAQTLKLLSEDVIFKQLKKKCKKVPDGNEVLSLINDVTFYSYHRAKLIIRYMPEFTLHDCDHLFRVLNLMSKLIPINVLNQLSIPEYMLLIITAFFHDLGMAPSESKIKSWLGLWLNTEPTEIELLEYNKFNVFLKSLNNIEKIIKTHRDNKDFSKAELILYSVISDYIRINHAKWAKEIISEDWDNKLLYRDFDLGPYIAELCYSHNEDSLSLINLSTSLLCGPDTYICLPFIGVMLRLSDLLDFDAKRTPDVLFKHLVINDPISLKEWQKHRSVSAWSIDASHIIFSASCTHPAIEATIRKFCDTIDNELIKCNVILSMIHDSIRRPFPKHYNIRLPYHIDRSQIGPKLNIKGEPKYIFKELKFNLNQDKIMQLLMGSNLYNYRQVALRELVQNSVDACLLRKNMEEKWGTKYDPKINIIFERENNTEYLIVEDNGIGMDDSIIKDYLSNKGSTYYNSKEYLELKSKLGFQFVPISRFGIGILSIYLISDYIEIETRKLIGPSDSGLPIKITINKPDTYFLIQKGSLDRPSTKVKVRLIDNHPWKGLEWENKIQSVKDLFPASLVPIEFREDKNKEIVNSSDFYKIGINDKNNLEKNGFISDTYDRTKIMEIKFNNNNGILGTAVIAWLEEDNTPVFETRVQSIAISKIKQTLNIYLRTSYNKINEVRQFLSITKSGETIKQGRSYIYIKSYAILSLHGFYIPMQVFPHIFDNIDTEMNFIFPFPMYLKLNIINPLDLDLNTSRDRILPNDKWYNINQEFNYIFISSLKKLIIDQYDLNYWERLKNVWHEVGYNEYFKRSLF